jgi:hypothetical protein
MASKESNIKQAIGQIEAKILRLEHQKQVYERMLTDLQSRTPAVTLRNRPVWQPGLKEIAVVDTSFHGVVVGTSPTRVLLVRTRFKENLREFLAMAAVSYDVVPDHLLEQVAGWMLVTSDEEFVQAINDLVPGAPDYGQALMLWLAGEAVRLHVATNCEDSSGLNVSDNGVPSEHLNLWSRTLVDGRVLKYHRVEESHLFSGGKLI